MYIRTKIGFIMGGLVAIILLFGAYIYFTQLRAIPQFQPTGQYYVGATNFDFEFQSQITKAPRKINIRAWYPSDVGEGEINLIYSQRMAEKIAEFYQMPDFMTATKNSLSFKNVPLAGKNKKFPVLIFNHGFGSFAEQNSVNMQQLASNGYIIFSISHPEQSLLTEYADGSFIYNNAELAAFIEQMDREKISQNILQALNIAIKNSIKAKNFTEYWQTMRFLAKSSPFANMQPFLRAWIEDSNMLINAIAEGDSAQFPAIFIARMDGEKIGIFGHSLGGMTAIAASIFNDNIKAVINIDGPFAFDEAVQNINLPVPTCILMSEGLAGLGKIEGLSEINTPLMQRANNGGCIAIFRGAWHMNFTDMNYIPLLRLLKILGPVNQEKFGIEFNNILLNFFDRHLKKKDIKYAPIYDFIVEYSEY